MSTTMRASSSLKLKVSPPSRRVRSFASGRNGLSHGQETALGLLGSRRQGDSFDLLDVNPASLSAKVHYRPDLPVYDWEENADQEGLANTATRMYAGRPGGAVVNAGGYGGNVSPPDLPSLLLNGRICFLGMPLVTQVTELIVAQLLFLNYDSGTSGGMDKPIYLYINSSGSQEQKQAVGFETEATAILDTIAYVSPPVHTIAISKAHGNAALLLAAGAKGCRAALPHSSLKISPPRLNRAAGRAVDVQIKANELDANAKVHANLLSKFTGKNKDDVLKDISRDKYFTPETAVDYGIIDSVISPRDLKIDRKDYDRILAASGGGGQPQSQSRRSHADGPEAGAA
jgi:ATP-dependent Clp protease protease subunit